MALLTWNQSLSVNIKSIDEQHQKLFSLINLLHEAMKSGKTREVMGPILKELANYTVYHFNEEEELMRKYGYQFYELHVEEHNEFRAKTADLLSRYEKSTAIISLEVMNFLRDWINNHIKDTDKQYEKFFQQHGII